MAENQLAVLSRAFAVSIIKLCDSAKENKPGGGLLNQLLRAGTSIGANIHEANYASSRADFVNKLRIALKECYETEYWLDVFLESGIISREEHKEAYSKCSKIRVLLIASINTANENSLKQ